MDLGATLHQRGLKRREFRKQAAAAAAASTTMTNALGANAAGPRQSGDASDTRSLGVLANEAGATAQALSACEAQIKELTAALALAKKNDWRKRVAGMAFAAGLALVALWGISNSVSWVGDRVQALLAGGSQNSSPAAFAAELPYGVEPFTPIEMLTPNVESVRVRAGPSTQSEVVGTLAQGDGPSILGQAFGEDRTWYYLALPDGVRGFVAAELLSAPGAAPAPELAAPGATPVDPAAEWTPLPGQDSDIEAGGKPTAQPFGAIQPQPLAAAPPIVGVYVGTYTCSQGVTGLRLTIRSIGASAYEATFDFYPTRENPGVPSGSAVFSGAYAEASRTLRLDGQRWVQRPGGYNLITLDGRFDPSFQQYSGSIPSGGCSSFSTYRQN